jgi:hypothetical protein
VDLYALDPEKHDDMTQLVQQALGKPELGMHGGLIPADCALWPEAFEVLLESARSGTFPEGFDAAIVAAAYFRAADPGCGLDEAARDAVRDRTLLVLWYWLYRGGLDEEEAAALGTWLEGLCRGSEKVRSDIVRGRLIWLKVNLLDERAADDEIERYLRQLHDNEQSAYVWERIAAFLGGWDGTWRLYADLHGWPQLAERDGFEGVNGIVSKQSDLFARGLPIVEGYRSRLLGLVDAAIGGSLPHESVNWIFERSAEAGFGLPLPVAEFSSRYHGQDRTGCVMLLRWLERYLASAPEGTLDAAYLSILADAGLGNPGRLERVAGRLAKAELERRAGNPNGVWRALLEALREAQRGTDGEMGTVPAQDLHQKLQPRIVALVGKGGITEPALDMIEDLLGSPSGFMQSLAVDMCLLLWRSGHTVDSLAGSLKTVLAASPETTGLMNTKGADLKEAPVLPFFFMPHVDSFLEGAKSMGDKEGGFMNLGNLTGLLEVVTKPSTAWRAATVLRGIAAQRDDQDLLEFLAGFREENEVLADLEPLAPLKPSGPQPAGSGEKVSQVAEFRMAMTHAGSVKSRKTAKGGTMKTTRLLPLESSPIVGPLTVPEIAGALAFLAAGSGTGGTQAAAGMTARNLRDSLAVSITARYAQELEDSRHAAIRSVFGDGEAVLPRLFTMVYGNLREAGGVVQPGRHCLKIPEDREPDSWHADLLAWYQPRAYLGQEDAHGFGVHFCAGNLLRCAVGTGSDPAALVRVVAVHEWFHALVELVLGRDRYVAHDKHHGKGGFCRLEEAAANALARVHLLEEVAEDLRAPIDTALFMEPQRKGVEGYGEWKLMGTDPQLFVPSILGAGKLVNPPAYDLERKSAGFQRDGFEMSVANGNWKTLLSGLDGETIPCWIDFRGLVD